MRFFLLLTLFLFQTFALGAGDVDGYFKKVKGKTVASRVESASLAFLGAPYLDSPLGEGPGAEFDQGPSYRFDGFDCTTFVETVLALATAKTASEFEPRLQKIRYQKGRARFEERNHFPCIDWIPHNTKSGLLADITQEVAGNLGTVPVTASVNKKGWFEHLPITTIRVDGITPEEKEKRLAALKLLGERFKPEVPSFSFIPINKVITRTTPSAEEEARRKIEEKELAERRTKELTASGDSEVEKKVHDEIIDLRLHYLIKETEVDPTFLARVPSAAILNVVRPGWTIPGTTLNISHQGFVIRKPDAVYFRHVNKGGKRAKDVLLANYLRLCLLSPSIKGINLLKPVESPAPAKP